MKTSFFYTQADQPSPSNWSPPANPSSSANDYQPSSTGDQSAIRMVNGYSNDWLMNNGWSTIINHYEPTTMINHSYLAIINHYNQY